MKRKILVLEDEENIRSFLVLNLKRSGYEVIEAVYLYYWRNRGPKVSE